MGWTILSLWPPTTRTDSCQVVKEKKVSLGSCQDMRSMRAKILPFPTGAHERQGSSLKTRNLEPWLEARILIDLGTQVRFYSWWRSKTYASIPASPRKRLEPRLADTRQSSYQWADASYSFERYNHERQPSTIGSLSPWNVQTLRQGTDY